MADMTRPAGDLTRERAQGRSGLPGRPMLPVQPALLEAIVADALDPAYADAAARRPQSSAARTRSAVAVLLLAGGLAVGLTIAQGRVEAPAVQQTRSALRTDVQQRTGAVNQLGAQVEALRRDEADLRTRVLDNTQQDRQLAGAEEDLSAANAETAVTGPGIAITVPAATGAAGPTGSAEQRPDGQSVAGLVQDRDLQQVVNALWAAGAEAISVGGIRLSPTTSIRTAGQTILVDYRPLAAPYTLLAVGEPGSLENRFRIQGLAILTRLRDIGSLVQVEPRATVSLPAASGTEPRAARPLPSPPPVS
jgi:uncharacterized protein YlxW (UPF0749 family)